MGTGSTELFPDVDSRIIENKESDILPDSPIDVARLLIHAEYEYNNSKFAKKVLGLPDKSTDYKYSIKQLREIAKHILVFCEENEDDR